MSKFKFVNTLIYWFVGNTDDLPSVSLPTLPGFTKSPKEPWYYTERQLLNLESGIGMQLFGPIPEGHRREFFCLDKSTWIWHEEWTDEHKTRQTATIRYEIQKNGVLKVQDGARYNYLEGEELQHLMTAIEMYYQRVTREVYGRDPLTGQKLAAAA